MRIDFVKLPEIAVIGKEGFVLLKRIRFRNFGTKQILILTRLQLLECVILMELMSDFGAL